MSMRKYHSHAVRLALVVFCLSTVAYPSKAAEPVIDGSPQGKVIEFGIIKSLGTTQRSQASETLDGSQSIAHGPKFGQHTTKVPAKLGTSFGFWFQLTGISEKDSVELKKIVRHPRMKNSKGQEEDHYTTTDRMPVANRMVFAGAAYSLDQPQELKPGTWTFEIYYRDTKLVSQSFTVYTPK